MTGSKRYAVRKVRGYALLAGAVGLGAIATLGNIARASDAAAPTASQPTPAELVKQIQELQKQVQQLSAKQDQQQAVTTKEVDETVTRVLQDADKRSQLMQMEGFTAGWDKGRFVLQSADGNYSFKPMFQLQIRNAATYNSAGSGDTQDGFEIRRMKFGADGTAVSKDLYYFLLWNTANGGTNAGNLFLEQAWIKYHFADDWSVRTGQFVDPAVHEQNMSSKYQLAVDRSLLNQILTGAGENFTQGATLVYQPKDGPWKGEIGVTDGVNTSNTDFHDLPTNTTDFGATGRLEYYAMGDPADYNHFSALKDKSDLLVFGAGGDFTEGGSTNSLIHTADAQYSSTSGISAYGAYEANYVSTPGTNSYNYGFLGQVGYLLPNQNNWEVFGRYDWTHLDHALVIGTGSEKNFHEITVGVNYYLFGQNAKITVDGSYLPNGSTGPSSLDQVGTTSNEFTLRAQFQLLL